jgi:hypothetical protein
MSTHNVRLLFICVVTLVVVEQIDPLAPPGEAKYRYKVNHDDPNEFYLSYPRGKIVVM